MANCMSCMWIWARTAARRIRRRWRQTSSLRKTWARKLTKRTGKSVAEVVADFVREKHITQVVFGRSATTGWSKYFYLSAIHKFLRDAPPVDVHIVTQEPS